MPVDIRLEMFVEIEQICEEIEPERLLAEEGRA